MKCKEIWTKSPKIGQNLHHNEIWGGSAVAAVAATSATVNYESKKIAVMAEAVDPTIAAEAAIAAAKQGLQNHLPHPSFP